MPQALQTTTSLDDAAVRIKGLMKTVATSIIELGAELKKARDQHFPMARTRRQRGGADERPGWKVWLKDNFKLTASRASTFIRVSENYGQRSATRLMSGSVLEELLRVAGREEVEQEIITENALSLRERGRPITQRRARAIIDRHHRRDRGQPESAPQLPTASEAQAIARAQREVGNVVLIPARDGNFYTGADESEISRHEKARDLALMVEYAIDTLLKVELTPHEYMTQTPQWLRWWLTKEGNVSTKGRKLAEVARWLTALSAAVESTR